MDNIWIWIIAAIVVIAAVFSLIAVFIRRKYGSIAAGLGALKKKVPSSPGVDWKVLAIGGFCAVILIIMLSFVPFVWNVLTFNAAFFIITLILLVLTVVAYASLKGNHANAVSLGTKIMWGVWLVIFVFIGFPLWFNSEVDPASQKHITNAFEDELKGVNNYKDAEVYYRKVVCLGSQYRYKAREKWLSLAPKDPVVRRDLIGLSERIYQQGCLQNAEKHTPSLPAGVEEMNSDHTYILRYGRPIEVTVGRTWSVAIRQPDGMKNVQHNRLDKAVKLDYRFNKVEKYDLICVDKAKKPDIDVEYIQYRISECNSPQPETTILRIDPPSVKK